MDHAMRRPMLAAGILSVALHAAALALVLAQLDAPAQEPRSIAVEIAWAEQGAAAGAAFASNMAELSSSMTANLSAASSPSMSPSGLARGSSQLDGPGTAPAIDPGPSDQVRGQQLKASDALALSNEDESTSSAVAERPPAQDALREIKVGADLRSAPTRSRSSGQRLASAQPSSPAFSRKREKEPEPQRSEPSLACGRGQGEGGAACAIASKSSAMPASEAGRRQRDDTESGASESSAADQSDATTTAASAAGTVAPGASPGGAAHASEGDIVQRSPPDYPLTARRQGLQGTTIVRARFDAHGKPEEVAVVASSGSASLDHAAREAVRRWRFRAGSAGVLDMPITFRLDGRQRGDVAATGG